MGHKSKRSWRRRLQYQADLRAFKGAVENSSARIRKPAVAKDRHPSFGKFHGRVVLHW